MTALLNVLQTALMGYIILFSLFRSKGKLRLILVAAALALIPVLLLLYVILISALPISFLICGFIILILTVAYVVALTYVTDKYYVRSAPQKERRSTINRTRNDGYNSDDYDIADNFAAETDTGIDDMLFKRETQYNRRKTEDELSGLFDLSKTEKTEPLLRNRTHSPSLGLDSGRGKKSFDLPDLSHILDEETKADQKDSGTDDILSDFVFDFGSGNSKIKDTGSEKVPEIRLSGDFSDLLSNGEGTSPSFEKFAANAEGSVPAHGVSKDAGATNELERELSLDELIGDFSFLKGTLAKVDSKFMTTDMDLEYVLLENINAQNIRAKIIDKNTIYINKFASEIALANAQRLIIENNAPDAKKLLAQLCCSSTDSAISNEAYVCFKEIVLGKESDLEIDDLIGAMIDKEEKLVELVKGIANSSR